MKKVLWIILLCTACLLAAACTSVDNSASRSSPAGSNTGSIAESTVETETISTGTSLDVPKVITRSYMQKRIGTDTELLQAALDMYAGQDTTFRVEIKVDWGKNRASHYAFHKLINYDVAKCYECRTNGDLYPTPAPEQTFSEQLYSDSERDLQTDTLAIPYLYADLHEDFIRALLNCEGVTVELIDELPESLRPYN